MYYKKAISFLCFFAIFPILIAQNNDVTIYDICDLLNKKLVAKADAIENMIPKKIVCDKFGNIEFDMSRPDCPNRKVVFNIFEIQNETKQMQFLYGEKPYRVTIYCQKCFTLLNWWKQEKQEYTNQWYWDFSDKEDANYVMKCFANLKSKCIKDPNK